MDPSSLFKDIPEPILVLLIIGLLWVANSFLQKSNKSADKHDTLLLQNTMALVELKTEIKGMKEMFSQVVRKVENLEEDMNHIHRTNRNKGINGNG